jgi:antitoxin PrlF
MEIGMDSRATLTVTAKGQVTLKRELLDHLGVQPGDKITVDLCAPRSALIRAASGNSIEGFFGCLPDKGLTASVEDMNRAIEDGWAGRNR